MLPQRTVHIVLTRFNVKTKGKESKIRIQPNWLNNRFELFETYCYPSVKAQTNQNFLWLIYFDSQTPEEYKERISKFCKEFPKLHPYYIDEWTTENVHNAIQSIIPEGTEFLLTTRLDNDDGVNCQFIDVLHQHDFNDTDWYYNFKDGLTYSDGYAYVHQDKSNAFLSRLEKIDSYKTAWELPHPDVEETGRISQLELPHAWLQVIHGENVSNKIRGSVISPKEWVSSYASLTKLEPKPLTTMMKIKDLVFESVLRNLRDFLIVLGKKVLRGTK